MNSIYVNLSSVFLAPTIKHLLAPKDPKEICLLLSGRNLTE
jgi:hypothetical protein